MRWKRRAEEVTCTYWSTSIPHLNLSDFAQPIKMCESNNLLSGDARALPTRVSCVLSDMLSESTCLNSLNEPVCVVAIRGMGEVINPVNLGHVHISSHHYMRIALCCGWVQQAEQAAGGLTSTARGASIYTAHENECKEIPSAPWYFSKEIPRVIND